MSSRRVLTPRDLGSTVRDARVAAGLTQAELAERADVSREWVVGLERGARPRAELTKVLGVLAALDQTVTVTDQERRPEKPAPSPRRGMTTAEITRRAIEQSRPTTDAARALADTMQRSSLLPKLAVLPKIDVSALMPKIDLSPLVPRPSSALLALMESAGRSNAEGGAEPDGGLSAEKPDSGEAGARPEGGPS
ncbi:helix-turn-helix transcriptional regulator [Brachybacterium kimchii]|uniref:Helix-turn-helix domain-containing protein n=1 Tax=Brachybacterium kimchii TaxID=2942909 RepID=A0ABY4NC79_9MICO|nr:helix-turn-helix transcriptional regulator [Brachybacterium kimchii]UQN31771.1 helix-turn-helix domain-containing protein [Brachybacterium kimchii]